MIKGGKSAMAFNLDNVAGQANIWLEKTFSLEPNQSYNAQIIYDFASADPGAAPWQLITGAAPAQFGGSGDLVYQGGTASSGDGFQWQEKSYEIKVRANADGNVYIAIGIRGNSPGQRHYFLDNVRITFNRDTSS